jgi:hypothetical protein
MKYFEQINEHLSECTRQHISLTSTLKSYANTPKQNLVAIQLIHNELLHNELCKLMNPYEGCQNLL